MDRTQINQMIASATDGVDARTTERVLEGLERFLEEQMNTGGYKGSKFARVIGLYQVWKDKT